MKLLEKVYSYTPLILIVDPLDSYDFVFKAYSKQESEIEQLVPIHITRLQKYSLCKFATLRQFIS